MWIIEETLPNDSLAAEAILHVRRHLRAAIRARTDDASCALAMLFGCSWADGALEQWKDAAAGENPLQAGATVIAGNEATPVVRLGHDDVHLESCRRWLEARIRGESDFGHIVADDLGTLLALSTAMDLALARHHDGENAFLPILIHGETGTGKELLANAIHSYWKRNECPTAGDLKVVQVAGISSDLIYGELFGAAKGAYTGATNERQGYMEAADGSTLLIDEIGDLPAEAQVALLRFLQTGKLRRLGETKERSAKVRILAATWHNLDDAVREGKFRMDLLHRIRGGGAIILPALRERTPFDNVVDDIVNARRKDSRFTRSARDTLRLYGWPGNLRELVTALDATVAVARPGDIIRLEDLPSYLQRDYLARPLTERAPGFICDMADDSVPDEELIDQRVERLSAMMLADVRVQAEELAALRELLRKLVDISGENATALALVERAEERSISEVRFRHVAQSWQHVLGEPDLPDPVVQVLHRWHSRLIGAADLAADDAKRALAGSAVVENPWLQMLQDLRSSPLLAQAPAATIVDVMLFVQTSLAQMAPEFLREFVQAYRANRFRGVIRLCIDKLETLESRRYIDAEQVGDGDRPEKRIHPRDQPPEYWRQLAEYPRLKDAREVSGYSAKTIREYMDKHELTPAWSLKK
jgi:DNA-binding NtrC family response regulator